MEFYQSNEKFASAILDLKNNSFSTVSGNSLDLLSSKIRPADENSLSSAVDVGGGVKYFFANLANPILNLFLLLG